MPVPSLSLSLPNVPPRHLPPAHRWLNRLMMVSILVGLGLVVVPFWPEAHYQMHRALSGAAAPASAAHAATNQLDHPAQPKTGRWLVIPKINVETPIVAGKDVGVLDREEGVWHQVGEVGRGNLVLAGHRFKYLPPNTTTFYHLDKLTSGDTIVLWWGEERRDYLVERTFTVEREAVEILNPTTREQLTLYTCTDLAAAKRLVVVAIPKQADRHETR